MDLLEKASKRLLKTAKFDNILKGSYQVKQFKLVKTKYGLRIIVVTEDFEVFLPPRFSAELNTEDQIIDMNEKLKVEPLMMIYGGKLETEHNRIDIVFKKI